jgi:hypothetical protein
MSAIRLSRVIRADAADLIAANRVSQIVAGAFQAL